MVNQVNFSNFFMYMKKKTKRSISSQTLLDNSKVLGKLSHRLILEKVANFEPSSYALVEERDDIREARELLGEYR